VNAKLCSRCRLEKAGGEIATRWEGKMKKRVEREKVVKQNTDE